MVSDPSGMTGPTANQWSQSQSLPSVQSQPVFPPQPTGTGRKMPQMPQQIQKQVEPNRQFGSESMVQNQNHLQSMNKALTQELKQDITIREVQDFRQNLSNNMRYGPQGVYEESERQMEEDVKNDNLNQQMVNQQEFRHEIRQQYQAPENKNIQQQPTQQLQHHFQEDQQQRQLHSTPQNQPQTQHSRQDMRYERDSEPSVAQNQQMIRQYQQPHQNYSQEEYQRYQNSVQKIQSSDTYNSSVTSASGNVTQANMQSSGRDMRAEGSQVAKPVQGPAPIPRTVPLHTVTQQLATSSASVCSPPSSGSSSSPKHKTMQSQQLTYGQQLQPKKTPPQVPECWSPPTDLSPILDVSPSIEAAEQEVMEKIKSSGESVSFAE